MRPAGTWSAGGDAVSLAAVGRATFLAGCLLALAEVQFELRLGRLVGAMSGAIRGRTPRILHRSRRTRRTGTC